MEIDLFGWLMTRGRGISVSRGPSADHTFLNIINLICWRAEGSNIYDIKWWVLHLLWSCTFLITNTVKIVMMAGDIGILSIQKEVHCGYIPQNVIDGHSLGMVSACQQINIWKCGLQKDLWKTMSEPSLLVKSINQTDLFAVTSLPEPCLSGLQKVNSEFTFVFSHAKCHMQTIVVDLVANICYIKSSTNKQSVKATSHWCSFCMTSSLKGTTESERVDCFYIWLPEDVINMD